MKVLLTLLTLLLSFPAFGETLKIYHIDVEQGDATLFIAPNGQTLLVDSGRNGHGNRIKNIMDQAGVQQIDYFVATHYHSDHYGGIDDLVEKEHVRVVRIYDRGDKEFLPSEKTQQGTYKDYLRAVGEDAVHFTRQVELQLDPSMTIKCISSGGVVIDEEPPVPGGDENDVSISLLITFGEFKYFLGADIEEATEKKIAEKHLVTNVDVYHADHHGSNTSSYPEFMDAISPRVIIISNGNSSSYRHPRQSTLNYYATLPGPPAVYQTNKLFAVGTVGGNVPDTFIADPETVDEDGTILITVDSSTGKYTVSYDGNTGTSFDIKKAVSSTVVIESLVPNPIGNDTQLETVTLKNGGTGPVAMSGWTLVDEAGAKWDLSIMGTIQPGESKTIQRNGMAMSLNNGGDEITLIDAQGIERDKFSYGGSAEGVAISVNN